MKVYSFDVFDTCLTRTYAQPTDLFYDLSSIFLNRYCAYGYDKNSITLFVYARKIAEKQIRKLHKKTREDINLLDIYTHLQTLLPWSFDIKEAMNFEMKLEQASLKPVLPIKLLIEKLRKQKYKIIFISDMYLPTEFIKECLIEHGIAKNEDNIYVSGDIGLSKHRGLLFRHVLKSEKIKPYNLIHYGDNKHADIKTPNKFDIQTFYFKKTQLTSYEKYFTKAKYQTCHQKNLLSKLAAYSRLSRITHLQDIETDECINKIITGIIAPLLTAYVVWIIKKAQVEGVDRLYFISRDGQILFRIAQELKKYISGPECCYLYGSRHAWFLPSITKCDEKNLHWLIPSGQSTSVKSILARLDIVPTDIEALFHKFGFNCTDYDCQLNNAELTHFKQIIFCTTEITTYIENKAAEARVMLGQYLTQEQLNDGTNWALVDVGWRLNCQHALKRVITALDWQCSVKGYYLDLAKDHLPVKVAGNYHTYTSQKTSFSKRALLIEHVFTPADHSTTIGYQQINQTIKPIFKEVEQCPDLVHYTNILHTICCDYAKKTAEAGIWHQADPLIDKVIQDNALNLLSSPSEGEVLAIAWITVVCDQLHLIKDHQKLACKMSISNLIELAQLELGLRKKLSFSCGWFEGCAMISPFVVKHLSFLMLFVKRNMEYFKNT